MEVRIPPNTFDDLRPFWLKRAQKRCRQLMAPVQPAQLLLKKERVTRNNEHASDVLDRTLCANTCAVTAALTYCG